MTEQPITLTKKDVAEMLNVSPKSVDNWRREGKLRSFRIGREVRFTQADVDLFVSDARKAAGIDDDS